MKAVTSTTMRHLDAATIQGGTPGGELMERAGAGAAAAILDYCRRLPPPHWRRFLVLTGKGNNGGDGHVIARYLGAALPALGPLEAVPAGGAVTGAEPRVTVLSVCPLDELTGDARRNAERLPPTVPFLPEPERLDEFLRPGTVVVDCWLGTGVAGAVKEPLATLIAAVNASGLPVIAVDVPSGLNADTGAVGNIAVVADLTVTMGLPKTGFFLGRGPEHTGCLRVVDIGLPASLVAAASSAFTAVLAPDVSPHLRRLPAGAHKGTMGRLLVVGGSVRYPGAPLLAGLGALRSGGGLVTVAYPESLRAQLGPRPNALIQAPIPDDGAGFHGRPGLPALLDLAVGQDVLALGPGLGREPESLAVIEALLKLDKPVVLDADGLGVFAANPHVLPRPNVTVLTPHPGELARLITALGAGELLTADRFAQARGLASRLGAWVVLKGRFTVIAGPKGELAVNTSGTPALATGGTGDVLTGMIAAWLHQLRDAGAAARTAVFLHGYAAELALPGGQRGLIADDLPALVGQALRELSPHA